MWAMNQWDYVLTSFPVDEIFVLHDGKVPENELQLTIYKPRKVVRCNAGVCHRATMIRTAEELPKDSMLVVSAPKEGRTIQGNECLHSFQHPKNAIYMFGQDNVNLGEIELGNRVPDHLVYIEAKTHELYAHVAAALVLYDRIRKRIANG
jgi:hypothetical protein